MGKKLDGEGRTVTNRTIAIKCLVFVHCFTSFDQIFYKSYSHTHIHKHKLTKTQVNTHKQASGLMTDVLNQRRSTLVLISFLSSFIFVLIASCIFTMRFISMLPCLVKTKKNTTCIPSDNILWSVFLLISVLCSNIFSHAAIDQCMRHKKRKHCLKRKICCFVFKKMENKTEMMWYLNCVEVSGSFGWKGCCK